MPSNEITLGTELADKLFLVCLSMTHFAKSVCNDLINDSYTPAQAQRDLDTLNSYEIPDIREVLKQIIALNEKVMQ
jgi:hypothetical protein